MTNRLWAGPVAFVLAVALMTLARAIQVHDDSGFGFEQINPLLLLLGVAMAAVAVVQAAGDARSLRGLGIEGLVLGAGIAVGGLTDPGFRFVYQGADLFPLDLTLLAMSAAMVTLPRRTRDGRVLSIVPFVVRGVAYLVIIVVTASVGYVGGGFISVALYPADDDLAGLPGAFLGGPLGLVLGIAVCVLIELPLRERRSRPPPPPAQRRAPR